MKTKPIIPQELKDTLELPWVHGNIQASKTGSFGPYEHHQLQWMRESLRRKVILLRGLYLLLGIESLILLGIIIKNMS